MYSSLERPTIRMLPSCRYSQVPESNHPHHRKHGVAQEFVVSLMTDVPVSYLAYHSGSRPAVLINFSFQIRPQFTYVRLEFPGCPPEQYSDQPDTSVDRDSCNICQHGFPHFLKGFQGAVLVITTDPEGGQVYLS
jgi:hypothetical protein